MKKITLALVAMVAVAGGLVAMSAFEAHVINVTAQIENALSVNTEAINFGTVFPQEHLDRTLNIALSSSFLTENRVDDVNYIIRQKPKCGVTNKDATGNGTVLTGPTWTGHVIPDASNQGYHIDCEIDRPAEVPASPEGPDFWLLPSLCEYISKEPDGLNDQGYPSTNDGTTPSFHKPFTVDTGTVTWLDTKGRLAKNENELDTTDNWTIDLSVPCFGGACAQDWAKFVTDINPIANPAEYVQDIANEHKIFGCNLWVEVTGVSEAPSI